MSDPTLTPSGAAGFALLPTQAHSAAGWLLITIGLAFSLFALFPQLDLQMSAWFYWPEAGFPAGDDARFKFLRATIWGGSQAMFALALAGLAANAHSRRAMADIPSRVWTFVLCLYALGPGVMVELVTKPLWGRARPASTTLFGGDQPFSLPTEFVDHCSRNCSFVSGEVSGATALAIALLILVVRLRNSLAPLVLNAVVVLALLLPLASALQRISAGRHFLSDTVLAMLLTLLLALGLAVALRLFPKPSRTS